MQINNTPTSAAGTEQSNADTCSRKASFTPPTSRKRTIRPTSISLAGEYVATIAELPPISASGSSLVLAENNLNARISLLV